MRLRTLGGLWIEADQPPPALGPRRMALLALVAASGRRGISRDRILALLWPEAESDQARHTLSQTLYSLRRDTGRDWIVAAPELRLDPAITSDIADLYAALAAGEQAAALALYTGEFLEGFYLTGADEFERWVEEERARLRDLVLAAAEQAAAEADRNADHAGALRVWTRLTQLDPLSARYAAGRMRALAASGDRPGALAHARDHEVLVRRELDADVDPSVRALARTLRSQPAPHAATPQPVPQPAMAPVPDVAPAPSSPHRRTRRLGGIAVAAVALVALAWQLVARDAPAPNPFLAVGVIRTADTSVRAGVVRDMLATGLGSVPGLQVLANSRVLELTSPGADTVPGAIAGAARRAGATELVEGELVPEAGAFRLTLRRITLRSGLVRQGYTVRGTDPASLVDSAAAAIARDLGALPPRSTVTGIRTASPQAYALYEEGLQAFYTGEHGIALRLMRAALDRDSTFAMAAYYAFQSSTSVAPGIEGDAQLRRLARRLAPRAIERERLLIEGSVALVDSSIATSVAIAETLSVRYPEDPDGQVLLGNAQHGAGNWAASVSALERALRMDSLAGVSDRAFCRRCAAFYLLTQSYMWWDSLAAAERTARRSLSLRLPGDQLPWTHLAEPLLRQGRRAEALAAMRRSDPRAGDPDHWSRGVMQRDMIRQGEFAELDRQLLADLQHPSRLVRGAAAWLMFFSLRNQGRLREAVALSRDNLIPGLRIRLPQEPERQVQLGMAILAAESGRPLEAARLYRREAEAAEGFDIAAGIKARLLTWRWTHVGTALAAAGDTASVRRLADTVEMLGRGSNFGRDLRLHHFLRGLVHQHAGRHAEAIDQFRLALHSLTEGYTRINLELARSLMALGRPDEAIAVLRPALRGGVDGSNSYLTHTELHEAIAGAFELAGRFDSATVHYRAVERAWRRADPEFAARHAHARTRANLP